MSIFWIHASSITRFVESFKRIAAAMDIPGREIAEIDLLQLVRDHIEMKHKREWLMIVDNVDDRYMFFQDQSYKGKPLREYMPESSQGAIIYTTRNKEIAMDLDHGRNPIEVSSMNVEEALMLLGPKVRANSNRDQQIELLEELIFLPLAITQAVAFMLKRRKSISQYLNEYKRSDSTKLRLLSQKSLYHGREARSLESVISTFMISFQSIKSENRRAAGLLSIMSFLDRQSIPDSLLLLDGEEAFDFEDAVELLNAFSLIARNEGNDASNMHRLVQIASRAWLAEYEHNADTVSVEALELLSSRFPDGWYENWSTCSTLLPHADAVLNQFTTYNDLQAASKAQLLLHTASYLRRQGHYKPAELRSAEAKTIFERIYGLDNADTLAAIAEYAMTVHKRGSWEEAARLQRIVLEGREKVLATFCRQEFLTDQENRYSVKIIV